MSDSTSTLLDPLVRSEALSPFQADWLAENWPDLQDDWASDPRFHDVREHTRAYIDRLRQENRD